MVVKHRDYLARFDVHSSNALLSGQGRVRDNGVNPSEQDTEAFLADGTSRIAVFCAKRDGQRRATHNTEKVLQAFQGQEDV